MIIIKKTNFNENIKYKKIIQKVFSQYKIYKNVIFQFNISFFI